MAAFSADRMTLMTHPELQKFAQQLSVWTELIIENGRTPFRRVDLYPKIHTDQGVLQPPLVFWINRQSMMAGAIMLLPEQDIELELEHGRSCCEALGLKHFVTWESDQVRIWQQDSDGIHQHQQFSFKHAEHPDSFRHLLGDVLEALKLLAVIGLVPSTELSPHYLHNLFQTALDLALPAQVNSYRSQRADEELSTAEDADQLANEANRLLLLQLLSLAWHQQLPSAILPEKLERAIQLSLPQLPETLKQTLTLSITSTPPALPYETAVCFHHLLLRLRQLSWRQSEQRAMTSIQLLINGWAPEQQTPQATADVHLYPQSPVLSPTTQLILSDSPSLLAAASLLQDLSQQPQKELVHGNLFKLDFGLLVRRSICGLLNNPRLLSREERHQFTTLFRTSWPNRRFRIAGDKPLWFWELIHLLGLSKDQKTLHLTLPRTVITSAVDEAFWSLLLESYSLQKVTDLGDQLIILELIPEAGLETPPSVVLANETRTLVVTTETSFLRNQLLLALQLPTEIFQLLGSKLVWPNDEVLDETALSGLQFFTQSRLWKRFEQILNSNPATPQEDDRQDAAWPRPDILHLNELAREQTTVTKKQAIDPDQLLAELLQVPTLATLEMAEQTRTRSAANPRNSDKDLLDELAQQLQREGVPTFPDKYLYFLEQPEMANYHFTPPLIKTSELLGEIELEDAAGQRMLIYGEELANALLLCSELGKPEVELPTDRQQLLMLQQHYWKDMLSLHKQLNNRCHNRLKSSKAANKLTKKVWKKLNLPKLP